MFPLNYNSGICQNIRPETDPILISTSRKAQKNELPLCTQTDICITRRDGLLVSIPL